MTLEQLETEALKLSTNERARLAERLISSLDEGSSDDEAAVEGAWMKEVSRRIADLDAGTVEGIPAEEVIREARARLRSK